MCHGSLGLCQAVGMIIGRDTLRHNTTNASELQLGDYNVNSNDTTTWLQASSPEGMQLVSCPRSRDMGTYVCRVSAELTWLQRSMVVL